MRKFHRKKGQRRSFLKGLANNLILKEKIKTTAARAKDIRPIVEHLITIAKKQNLASLRLLFSKLPRASANKLFYELAPRYKERSGGYLRIIKETKTRKRDGTTLAMIEFLK